MAFFNFLRALIQLNFLLGLVLAGGVLVPSALLAGGPELQHWGWVPQEGKNITIDELYKPNGTRDSCSYSLSQHAMVSRGDDSS